MAIHKQFQNTAARICQMQDFKIHRCLKVKQIKVSRQSGVYPMDEKIFRLV